MDTTTQDNKAITRTKVFGRVYDHDVGSVTVTSAADAGFKLTFALNDVPQETLRGFALQNLADYVVGEGNDAFKDPGEGETPQEAATKAMQEALDDAKAGRIDFRSGVGLGGMRSAIGALGSVLFELGYSKVKDQHGTELTFKDLHEARAAVKTLYLSTQPKGPFKQKTDDKGQPVTKDGAPVMVPAAKDSNLTGRMIFNAIMQSPKVKDALAAKRTAKKPSVVVELS